MWRGGAGRRPASASSSPSPGSSSAASTSSAPSSSPSWPGSRSSSRGAIRRASTTSTLGVLRFTARTYAYFYLQTDEWPPFGFEEAPGYPIRAPVEPPLERYNRWKTGFRLILGFPVYFMLYLIGSVWPVAAAIAWFHIVFTGRNAAGTHNLLSYGHRLPAAGDRLLPADDRDLPPVSQQDPLTQA